MAEAIDAIVTQQPDNETYRVMTAVAYYAGLRPSEVVMLRVRSAELTTDGWGRVDVTEADISFDEPGEPKTGPRSVRIPPVLVAMRREWVQQNDLTSPDQLRFQTRNHTGRADRTGPGRGISRSSRWAGSRCGYPPTRGRTKWLRAGMPFGETARRLGHSVETLVHIYVGALDDQEQVANQRIDSILAWSPRCVAPSTDSTG
jgi:integrase